MPITINDCKDCGKNPEFWLWEFDHEPSCELRCCLSTVETSDPILTINKWNELNKADSPQLEDKDADNDK